MFFVNWFMVNHLNFVSSFQDVFSSGATHRIWCEGDDLFYWTDDYPHPHTHTHPHSRSSIEPRRTLASYVCICVYIYVCSRCMLAAIRFGTFRLSYAFEMRMFEVWIVRFGTVRNNTERPVIGSWGFDSSKWQFCWSKFGFRYRNFVFVVALDLLDVR